MAAWQSFTLTLQKKKKEEKERRKSRREGIALQVCQVEFKILALMVNISGVGGQPVNICITDFKTSDVVTFGWSQIPALNGV